MIVDWYSFRKHYTRPKRGQFPVGSRVYIGHQGKGKTLSMSKYAFDIKKRFPECKIFSNVLLLDDIDYTFVSSPESVSHALGYRNGSNGVLVLLDEAHLYFHTKKGIPLDVLTAISQQRKDRRRLVFSSQIWNELDISLRKQVPEVVNCYMIGMLVMNVIYDGYTVRLNKNDYSYGMDKIRTEIFKINDEYCNRYDTYQKIITNENYDRSWSSPAAVAVPQASAAHKMRDLLKNDKWGKV